eukprot:6200884-Pleurochrysis_carterae.AAC.1
MLKVSNAASSSKHHLNLIMHQLMTDTCPLHTRTHTSRDRAHESRHAACRALLRGRSPYRGVTDAE